MADSFKCKRGILISPDDTNGGSMVPLFLKTRSKDIYMNTKTIDIFGVEEYADRVSLKGKLYLDAHYNSFCDIHSGYSNGTVFHCVFFPFAFKNDEYFNVHITPQIALYNRAWANASIIYQPLYTNTSKNSISGMRIMASSTVYQPSIDEDKELYYNIAVDGNVDNLLDYKTNGYMYEEDGSKYYGFSSPFDDTVFYYSYDGSNTDAHSWTAFTKADWHELWGKLTNGSAMIFRFYYDEVNNKILFKPESI